jgi:hypothetical protein
LFCGSAGLRPSPRSGRMAVAHSVSYGSEVRVNSSEPRQGRKSPSLRRLYVAPLVGQPRKNGVAPLPFAVISFAPCGAWMGWGADFPTACAMGYDLPPASRAGLTCGQSAWDAVPAQQRTEPARAGGHENPRTYKTGPRYACFCPPAGLDQR